MSKPYTSMVQFSLPLHIKYTLFTGIFCGLFIHLYMLTNKLPNIDEMSAYSNTGASLSSGRWFLDFAGNLAGNWSMPWVNGFLGILYLSLTSCFIVTILNLKNKINCMLVSLMIVSFPSVVSVYTYMFTADAFFLSILINAIGVYCVRKFQSGFIYGAVLFAFGLGIYQSFICFSAALLVLSIIFDVFEDKKLKAVLINGYKSIASLALGFLFYFLILKILISANGISLNSYQGINEMGRFSITTIPYQILKAYAKVILFFTFSPENFYRTPMIFATNLFLTFTGIFLFIRLILVKKLYYKKVLLLLALALLFPLAASFIYIMAPKAWVHLIMKFQYCLIYIFIIGLSEYSFRHSTLKLNVVWRRYFSRLLLCAFLILGFNNYLIANKSYFLLQSSYERLYSFYNKLSLRIEATEGYEWGQKVAIMGKFDNKMIYEDSKLIQEVSGITGIISPYSALSEENCYTFLKTYIGMNIETVPSATLSEIESSSYYQTMPTYPSLESIQIVNGICIVKMSETR